ncbi:hypothetical protein [Vibrio sp. Isolate24]|uniref:hypothetical protein n=1 Tax=Vibrio sp. Isolate24 TaxID=2908534 RepID=UPI001EFEA74B|nr:hypothetical protein [Vibrio sp. Isolate24]MCG9680452.1 hypothetical protein [Vibrio sp. Isolate24]
MHKPEYPFPPPTSAYWKSHSTSMSYDEAASQYEAQQGVDKKMQRNPVKSPATQALEANRINRASELPNTVPTVPMPPSTQQTAFAETQSSMAWPPYNPLAPEGEKDLTDKLKETLERNHIQVQVMTLWDAMVYTVNNWTAMTEDGKTFGADVLQNINKIKGYLDKGTAIINAVFLAKALGGLGIVAKETTTKNGKAAIVISSVWNDSKMHYATVNGINIKKNHPYPMDNPKIQQLGFAKNTKIRGAIKAGVLTIIISAALATEQLINNDEYHMVDWYGSMGTDLLKIGITSVLTLLFVPSSVPIIIGVAIAIGIAVTVDFLFAQFEVQDKITEELKVATEV